MADEWLDRYPERATVMRYIGRSGWNTLSFAGAIPDDELIEAVDESYRLVVGKLPKKLPARTGGTDERAPQGPGGPVQPAAMNLHRSGPVAATPEDDDPCGR